MSKENWNKLLSDEFNQEIDEWAASRNALIGDTAFPDGVGNLPNPWGPPREKGTNSHYALFNELVTKDLIRHYCDAIGDKNPLYRWDEYARNTRYGGIIAPNGILYCIGEAGAGMGKVAPGFGRSLAGGSTWTWYKVIRPGDTFHVMGTDMGVTEKRSHRQVPYRLFISMYRTTYLNQRDEIVATRDRTRVNIVAESRQKTESAFKYRERYRYTQEELDRIHQGYYDEDLNRRGAETRFWEDVVEGEEIFPVVAGPLTVLDSHCMMGAMGQQSAFGINWDMLRDHIADHGWIDPETNAPRWRAEGHLTDACGRATGLKMGGYGYHGQSEALMQKAIQNWMGDDGWLMVQSCKTRRPNWHGDTTWVKGKVTKKYTSEDGQFLVELELHCENQLGEVHQESTATVILPSRTRFLYGIK
ncbi:MAG TPA: MaoC family dehydratase N-terminal domain-containing protein [Anaerolineae bacterium]|nr:MaoC family dehydratase N-terminal domain-containing protein [Anaerolineae bacterium]HOQ98033.1 MaoC family dehydratase N-terminal domain-containing protein [Anaerolineae bacterium]HPL29083.1 MaoC family dehydratase N-terminal domain-containing protein [Anaerolineae bacterium]